MAGNVDPDKLAAHLEAMRPMDPAALAETALRDVARNRALSIHPARWRVAWYLHRVSPRLSLALAGRVHGRRQSLGRDEAPDGAAG